MMRKLMLVASGAVGYVLGTRAGRERYEQIKGMAARVKENPTVQEKAHQAADAARTQAPVVKDKLTDVAGTARSKVGRNGTDAADEFPDESMLNQEDPYPKGDLP